MQQTDSQLDLYFAEDIFKQINKLRRFPKTFIPFLEDRLSQFEGNIWQAPIGSIMTEEGPEAVSYHRRLILFQVKSAIEVLKGLKGPPMAELEWSDSL
jgi:hypothetical protein